MRSKSHKQKKSAETTFRHVGRAPRGRYSAVEKIRVVPDDLRGEDSIAALCSRAGINEHPYCPWSKEFLEADKERLTGYTARHATSIDIKALRAESSRRKEALAEVVMGNRLLKTMCARGKGGRSMRYSASE